MSTTLEPAPVPLSPTALAAALAVPDLTDPAPVDGPPHAIALLVPLATDALAATWGVPVRVVRTRPLVPVEDNYDRLGYAPAAVTRDVRYTRYASETCVLRSHTSAGVPYALRRLAAEVRSSAEAAADAAEVRSSAEAAAAAAEVRSPAEAAAGAAEVRSPTEAPADLLLALPGVVHRRDAIDRLHTGTPHQLDLWRVRRDGPPLDGDDLLVMVDRLVAALLPGRAWRTTPAVHPYTTGGLQVDVRAGDEWVEVAECGLAARRVLDGAGLHGWTGLALGIGLDRVLMLRKEIADIRLLRSTDPRTSGQLHDLSPYRSVSSRPPVRRDLSVAVDPPVDAEVLGDRVRAALGADADAVELVEVRATTAYEALPAPARERLGLRTGQVNALVRLVLRPVDRTLTDAEANELRDRVYAALHTGSTGEWTAPRAVAGTSRARSG